MPKKASGKLSVNNKAIKETPPSLYKIRRYMGWDFNRVVFRNLENRSVFSHINAVTDI